MNCLVRSKRNTNKKFIIPHQIAIILNIQKSYRIHVMNENFIKNRAIFNSKITTIVSKNYVSSFADMIVIEDYWNPGRIIDTYNDVLSDKDIDS